MKKPDVTFENLDSSLFEQLTANQLAKVVGGQADKTVSNMPSQDHNGAIYTDTRVADDTPPVVVA